MWHLVLIMVFSLLLAASLLALDLVIASNGKSCTSLNSKASVDVTASVACTKPGLGNNYNLTYNPKSNNVTYSFHYKYNVVGHI